MTPTERFEIALSLELGIPMSKLKDTLTFREYELYQEYFSTFGIGQEAQFCRSATEMIMLITQVSAAMGSTDEITIAVEDIYPQLSHTEPTADDELIDGQLSGWNDMPEVKQQQMIDMGLCTPEGVYIKTST